MSIPYVPILTSDEMRAADHATAELGTSTMTLMRHAGAAVARFVLKEYAAATRITILCGKGNNGGDGFVAAKVLKEAGKVIRVLLLGSPNDLKGDAWQAFDEMQLEPVLVPDEDAVSSPPVEELYLDADLLLDAVVGTGFKPPLRGTAAALRDRIKTLKIPVVAVDLPSGWDADSRAFANEGAFRADAVVSFTAPKLAHVCGNLAGGVYGPIVVADIGSPQEAVKSSLNLTWAGASKAITDRPRDADSNKGLYGHVLLVGGGRGKSGAPSMSALACLRSGAGLVTAAVAASTLPFIAQITPELMTFAMPEGANGELTGKGLDFDRLLEKKSVLAIGPGLGQEAETEAFVLDLLDRTNLPVVLDADALNILARHPEKIDGRRRTMVLTPHPGEMSRLAGISTKDVQANREPLAREFATRHGVTLVLKGWRTLIAHPDGAMSINTTGNPGMAKGGSGDILTGIVAALVAQFPDRVADAVSAAVYLHGLAADFAVREQDERTLLATDTVGHLWRAFRFRPEDNAGYLWIQGLPHGVMESQKVTERL